MLLPFSKKVGACYERAGVCRHNAEHAGSPKVAAAFLRIEQSWLNQARSFEQAEKADRVLSAVQQAIGPLTIRCPETDREASTGIETTYETLAGSWARIVDVHCNACDRQHTVPVRDGYIARSRA